MLQITLYVTRHAIVIITCPTYEAIAALNTWYQIWFLFKDMVGLKKTKKCESKYSDD